MALVGAIAVVGLSSPRPVANTVQAHEDGTNHIHPTPTPTPYPVLGLSGQVSLHSEAYYHKSTHSLSVTTTVINAPPPPAGWKFSSSSWRVDVNYQGWQFSGSCDDLPWDEFSPAKYENGKATCDISLPDYVDFDKLTEPMLVQVWASAYYKGDNRPGDLSLSEVIYIDLFDRDNWR